MLFVRAAARTLGHGCIAAFSSACDAPLPSRPDSNSGLKGFNDPNFDIRSQFRDLNVAGDGSRRVNRSSSLGGFDLKAKAIILP